MRVADMDVPRLLNLGDRVFYTHRASAMKSGTLMDVSSAAERRQLYRAFGYSGSVLNPEFSVCRVPLRNGKKLYRWITVWPELGHGSVCGLTTRVEGHYTEGRTIRSGGWEDDYEAAYISETERFPLYVVKNNLTERGKLIPPWACVPMTWADEHLAGSDDEEALAYVESFLLTAPEKVVAHA